MKLFDVYPLFDLEPVKGEGCYITDKKGQSYLDLYGGHAVISIGHSHPHYVEKIGEQLKEIGFYSNSVQNSMQVELANKLGKLSGYDEYQLFLCNSGAEANENALKLASFITGRSKVISFANGFHGRTSAAVAITDNAKIIAPLNAHHEVEILPLNDSEQLENSLKNEDCCAVIVEGIQGIGGVYLPDEKFMMQAERLCKQYGALFILDEIQSGYGRSGKFFAHQYTAVRPDLITMAKGMGNGFPIGGVMIAPSIEASYGMLGTTFGGSYLACAAAIAVLDVMEKEALIGHCENLGQWWMESLKEVEEIVEIRGKGLMIALQFDFPIKELRKSLLYDHHIVTGSAKNPSTLRLLPPLNITKNELQLFNKALVKAINSLKTLKIKD